jgi:hypothetical protein
VLAYFSFVFSIMRGLLFLLVTLGVASCAEVLMMPSSLVPVHRYNFKHLAAELIRRGHTVTWFEYGLAKVSCDTY